MPCVHGKIHVGLALLAKTLPSPRHRQHRFLDDFFRVGVLELLFSR